MCLFEKEETNMVKMLRKEDPTVRKRIGFLGECGPYEKVYKLKHVFINMSYPLRFLAESPPSWPISAGWAAPDGRPTRPASCSTTAPRHNPV